MTQLLQDKSAIANGTGGAVARTFARENATWQRGLVDQQAHQHPVAHQRPDRALNRLDVTVPAANSALQRARTRMREQLPQRRLDSFAGQPTAQERDLLLRFIDAHERADIAASISLTREDIRVTMPPHPWCCVGLDTLASLLERAIGRDSVGDWRLVPTSANRQPTAASYLRGPTDSAYRAFKLDVLRIEAGKISEITTFDASLFPAFGLPQTLS